jgi:DNA-binding NarL/FixJ family response regulator
MVNNDSYGQFSIALPTVGREDSPPKPTAVAASLRRTNRQLLSELRSQMVALREQHARFHTLTGPAGALLAQPSEDRSWPQYGLTGREIEVARLLAEGRRNTAIAAALGISPHTARHHTQRVLAKLAVHSRAEAGAKLRG